MNSKITIITVVRNAESTIEQTMLSVLKQTYSNIEYIIVDGASTDGTKEIIKNYELRIINDEFPNIVSFKFISEPDKGIYDAMNKGIDIATGEWINFMNAGDCFYKNDIINNIVKSYIVNTDKSFLYSDFYVKNNISNKLFIANYEQGIILHQSSIYKKKLHLIHGHYVVTKKIIVSDYLFFNSINSDEFLKIDIPISINLEGGISSAPWCYIQKLSVDYIFGRISLLLFFKFVFYFYLKISFKKIIGKRITRFISQQKKIR